MVLSWGQYFQNLLPKGADGTVLVLDSSCGFTATYEINGLEATFIGQSDEHDRKYNDMEVSEPFFSFGDEQENLLDGVCVDQLTLRLYPSDTLKDSTTTNRPAIYTAVVAGIFAFTALAFVLYDFLVGQRQEKVMARVMTQEKIVANLFPQSIRDRLYGMGTNSSRQASDASHSSSQTESQTSTERQSKRIPSTISGSKPIADLFLETTVLFADIAGFTAWSSAREPSHV